MRRLALALLLAACGAEQDRALEPLRAVENRAQSYIPAAPGDVADEPIEVVETASARGLVRFNGADREKLVDVTITGLEVVFDPTEDGHPLNDYHEAETVTSLTIHADVVRIRAPLRIPGADVTIHAPRLVFEDPDETNPGSIDLSAKESVHATKASRQPGDDGERGGNLTLFIGALEGERKTTHGAEMGTQTRPLRFYSKGSKGGPGGPGVDGRDPPPGRNRAAHTGRRAPSRKTIAKWDRTMRATPGGKGGDGGAAGALASTLPEVAPVAQRRGGFPGRTPSAKVGAVTYSNGKRLIRRYGKGGRAKRGAYGKTPEFERLAALSNRPGTHPEPLRLVVNRLRDLYLARRIEDARELCIEALEWTPKVVFTDPDLGYEFDMHRSALLTMAERLGDDLDYFGNPRGWVPLLSFEANYATFLEETESAVRMMALSYWLEKVWQNREDRIAGLAWAIEEKKAEIEAHKETIRNVRKLIPSLENESLALRRRTESFIHRLEAREKILTDRFKTEKEIRRVLGAVCDAMSNAAFMTMFIAPGVGPIVFGTAGMLAGELARGKETTVSGDTTSSVFRQVLDEEDAHDARRRLADLDPAYASDVRAFKAEVDDLSRDLAKVTRQYIEDQVRENLAGQMEDDFDAAVELNQILQRDGDFRELYDELIGLVTKRQVFREKVDEAKAVLEEALLGVQEAIWAIDAMEDAKRFQQRHLDPHARAVLGQMRRRARDRLVLYQYYLAKSFEYRMLMPCPIDPFKNRVYESAEKQFGLEKGDDHPFDMESPRIKDLVGIYRADLREIVELTIQGLNTNRFDPVVTTTVLELHEDELARLNETGTVALHLEAHGTIMADDRNARLVDVRIDEDATRFAVAGAPDQSYNATLDLTIEPPERSLVLWEDEAYSFYYGGPRATNLVLWGYTWNEPSGTGNPMKLSEGSRSLLARMVDPSFGDKNQIQRIHFRPSAHGEIVLRVGTNSSPKGVAIEIERLVLELLIEKNKSFRSRN